jgi:Uma2 family endonuclease
MSTATVGVRYTPQQYLALERKAATRSEYFEGAIIPMAGASLLHTLIITNLCREISSQLRDRPGLVCMNDLRVHVGPASLYTYPDVVAVADEPVLEDEHFDTLLNPTVIIEVLSPSTEAADRGYKFESYRQLDSLRQYALVAQDRVLVELYSRRGEEWVLSECNGLDDILRLDSLQCEVPLREIYEKTNLHTRARQTDA